MNFHHKFTICSFVWQWSKYVKIVWLYCLMLGQIVISNVKDIRNMDIPNNCPLTEITLPIVELKCAISWTWINRYHHRDYTIVWKGIWYEFDFALLFLDWMSATAMRTLQLCLSICVVILFCDRGKTSVRFFLYNVYTFYNV